MTTCKIESFVYSVTADKSPTHPHVVIIPHTHTQLVNAASYHFLVYLQVVLTNVALNQTWIALLIALICAFPAKAFRLSPIIAAVAGFSSGFFIPVEALHWG